MFIFDVIATTATVVNPQITGAINNLFTVGFEALLLLLTAGLTYGVKLGLGMIKNNIVRAFATRAVAYAENKIVGDEEKRMAVAAKIHEKFPRLSEEELNHYLEEAVINLQRGLYADPVTIVEK